MLSPDRLGFGGAGLLAVRVSACVAAAAALHLVVEQPVRVGGALPRWQAPVGLATGIASVLVLAVGLPRAGVVVERAPVVAADLPTVVTMVAPAADDVAAPVPTSTTAASVVVPIPAEPGGPGGPGDPPAAPPADTPPPTAAPRVPRLLVMGDSTGMANGASMQVWATATGRATVDVVSHYGCTFLLDGELKVREGWLQVASLPCVNLVEATISTARSQASDAVGGVHEQHAAGGLAPLRRPDVAGVRRPAVRGALPGGDAGRARRLVIARCAGPARRCAHPRMDLRAERPAPGSGVPTVNDQARAARYNAIVAEEVAAFPLVRVVPYVAALAGPDGVVDGVDRPDGLHVTTAAIVSLMESGFESTLSDAIADVRAAA